MRMRCMTLAMSVRIDDVLTNFATKNRVSKAEALRRAVAVLDLAEQEKIKGRSLGIVEEDKNTHDLHAIGRILGL